MCVLPLQVAELVNDGFFTDMLFYRIIQGFLAQFGVPADHAAYHKWNSKPRLLDEPNRVPFRRGEAKARRPSVRHPCASHAAASHPSVTHSHTQLSLSRTAFFTSHLEEGRNPLSSVCLSLCPSPVPISISPVPLSISPMPLFYGNGMLPRAFRAHTDVKQVLSVSPTGQTSKAPLASLVVATTAGAHTSSSPLGMA